MDIDFDADNQDEIVRTIKRHSELMRERNIDLAKAYELICGGKIDNMDFTDQYKLTGKHLVPYCLRHFYASQSIYNGVPEQNYC